MKQLFLIALMATVSFASKAQIDNFENDSDCELRIRSICYTESPCGSATPVSTWTHIPANTPIVTIPSPPTCPMGQSAGYEVDYDIPGCRGMSSYFTTNKATSCTPPYHPTDYNLDPCTSCTGTNHLIIEWVNDPSLPVNYFRAHP